MSTEQERSFIARISSGGANMTFFDRVLEKNSFLFENRRPFNPPAKPNLLTESSNPSISEMIVYFRCYEDYYNIQILSADYFWKFFSKGFLGTLGAYTAAGGSTTSFNLLNSDHSIITLDNLVSNTASVYLRARNAGLINKQQLYYPKIYRYGDHAGVPVRFDLEILERNVPYPTSSTPYSRHQNE